MSQRKLVYTALTGDAGLTAIVPANRWFSAGSIDSTNPPAFRFGLIRISGTFPTASIDKPGGQRRAEIWVHDEPGSYGKIDDALVEIGRIMAALANVSDADSRIACAFFDSESPDLFDEGYGSITKMSSWTLTGKK